MSKLVALVLTLPFLASAPSAPARGAPQEEKVDGYAEYRRAGALIVDGQVVRATAATRFKGEARSLDAVSLGQEVVARGTRQADGSILAREVQSRANGSALFEDEVLEATDQIEQQWLRAGRMYEPAEDGSEETIGPIVDTGGHAERVRGIMRRLTPPYVSYERQLRVHVVQTEEWNAAAMGNGAIWVYTGLVDSMSDGELAIVLGHELAHYTHEHSRRQAKTALWQGLAGLGAILAGEAIGTDTSRTVAALTAALGLTVWSSGYSRDHEDQADRVGLRYAHEGGFDVAAGPSLWAKFRSKYGEPDKVTNFFFGSHSRPSDRIRNIEREIRINYPERAEALTTVSFPEGPAGAEPSAPEAPAEPNEWANQVRAQLDAFRAEGAEGFETVLGPEIDELAPDEVTTWEVPVEGGTAYLVVGVCDADCDDLDLVIYDQAGAEVALDVEPDDYPVLQFLASRAGTWSLEVRMPGCDADTCVYGIEIYARRR